MEKLMVFVSSFLLSVLFTSCSNKTTYDNIQLNKRSACVKFTHPEYEECIKHTRLRYEDYQKQRQAVLEQ